MVTADDAVLAIRHAVQDHGDEHCKLGSPASTDDLCWFGSLLGWTWPASYLRVLERHNGVRVKNVILLSFLESIEAFLIHHREWHKPRGFWPVGSDECGGYFALCIDKPDGNAECPVVFLEWSFGTENAPMVARSYSEFVVNHFARECEELGCLSPIGRTDFRSILDD